jgi:hypothetical protein
MRSSTGFWCVLAVVVVLLILFLAYDQGKSLAQDAAFWKQHNRETHIQLHRMLRQNREMLTRHGLCWWLSDGSLLGAVRGGAIIYYDDDVDLSLMDDDAFRKALPKMREELDALGYTLKKHKWANFWQVAHPKSGANIDWFLYNPKVQEDKGTGEWRHHSVCPYVRYFNGAGYFSSEELFPLKPIELREVDLATDQTVAVDVYPAPARPWTHLARCYGQDFYKTGRVSHTHHPPRGLWTSLCLKVGGSGRSPIAIPKEQQQYAMRFRDGEQEDGKQDSHC